MGRGTVIQGDVVAGHVVTPRPLSAEDQVSENRILTDWCFVGVRTTLAFGEPRIVICGARRPCPTHEPQQEEAMNERTGERNEIYTTEAGEVAWRYFAANGAEIGRSSEGLHPDHGEERALGQVLGAHPGHPVWVERGPDLWVLLDGATIAEMLGTLAARAEANDAEGASGADCDD